MFHTAQHNNTVVSCFFMGTSPTSGWEKSSPGGSCWSNSRAVPGSPMLQARRHIHPAPFVWANAQRGQRGRRRPRKDFSMKKPLQILLDWLGVIGVTASACLILCQRAFSLSSSVSNYIINIWCSIFGRVVGMRRYGTATCWQKS